MQELVGHHLGQYELVAVLGRGGMATVYRARQASVDRDVAIKVISSDLAATEDFLRRFEREAKTVAALSHPHILKLFDYGQQDGITYLVMELMNGGSLSSLIDQGPMSLKQAYRLFSQVASALDYAHAHGIIHRDLKPQNVLLDEHKNAHLSDFGLAKILSDAGDMTRSALIGTPLYMAPEQWESEPVTKQTDIYALGVMLFELLSGQTPFSGETTFKLMHMHLYQMPPSIRELRPELPEGVELVVQRTLAKAPEDRFDSAGELAAALRTALSRGAGSTRNGATFGPRTHQLSATIRAAHPHQWRFPAWAALGGVALTVGMIFFVVNGRVGQLPFLTPPTSTQVMGLVPTPTAVASLTPSLTRTLEPTETFTLTATDTATSQPSPTSSATATATTTVTMTPTATVTASPTLSDAELMLSLAPPYTLTARADRLLSTLNAQGTRAALTRTPKATRTRMPTWTPQPPNPLLPTAVPTATPPGEPLGETIPSSTPIPTDAPADTPTETPTDWFNALPVDNGGS
jgi:serine/threonine-protein kinase